MRKKPLVVVIASGVIFAAVFFSVRRWQQVTDPDYRLRKGQEAARAGNYEEAERFALLLHDDRQEDHVQLLRGEIYFRQNDFDEAIRAFRAMKDRGALRLEAAKFESECLVNLGAVREAERVFRFVLSKDPDHIDSHRFLAAIYYDQGEMPRAVDHLHEVARLDPKDARPHRLIGVIFKDLDQIDDAIFAYEESLRRVPPDTLGQEVRVELAECLLKRGKNERVLELVEGIDTQEAVAVRVEALLNLERDKEALPLLEDAQVRFPGNATFLRLRARLYVLEKNLEAAGKLLEQAIQLDAVDFRSRHELAIVLERMGKTAEAQKQHQKVKEVQKRLTELTNLTKEAMERSWDADVRLRLAALCDQLQRPQLAQMWRNAAAACGESR
jgi:tetratricopeptide (TPR) repeat protein